MSRRTFSNVRVFFLVALVIARFAAPANATPVVVYGDSLSDNGNVYALLGGAFPPSPPYFNGRLSNGPVAVEYLATALGAPLVDFAVGGATTGLGVNGDNPGGSPTSLGPLGLPGLQTQFAATQASLGPYLNGLFVVWAGPNDFAAPSPADTTPQQIADRAVSNIVGVVAALQGLGVQRLLVPGMPDLGLAPDLQPVAAVASAFTDLFNATLLAHLPAGALYFDSATLFRSMASNPAIFGFTNVTDPCFDGATVCANPNEYLFWDGVHPTTAAHAVVGSAFAQTAVPEPSTLVLALTGLSAALMRRRRRQRWSASSCP